MNIEIETELEFLGKGFIAWSNSGKTIYRETLKNIFKLFQETLL